MPRLGINYVRLARLQAARPAEVNEQARLQTQAFEAINEVVRSSATDVVPMVVQLLPLFIGKLRESCQAQPQSAEAAERQSEIQVRVACLYFLC